MLRRVGGLTVDPHEVGPCRLGRWGLYLRRDPELCQGLDEEKTGINLPVFDSELRGVREGVVVTVPVFTKGDEAKSV